MARGLENAQNELERATSDLRREWDSTQDSWHDSRRQQAAAEFFQPTFDLSHQTLISLRAITEQAHHCLAALRLP